MAPTSISLTGPSQTAYLYTFSRGEKSYELTNHLGNVLSTITDKKIAVSSTGSSLIDHFTADVATAQDYYPFGMLIPGRTFTASGASNYRYGFNGKEKNDEISGPGNSIDFGNRMDDTRGGKWYSPDRIRKPWLSPYVYAADNPVNNIDQDGKDEIHFHFYTNSVLGPDGRVMGGPTTFKLEIIKANGPDRFFVHTHTDVIRMPTNYSNGGQATQEKTTEIYPWNPDSRSGFTKSTILGLIPVNDRDYATLIKYATSSPALKNYIETRSQGYEATTFDKDNYKGILEDIPAYNFIGKIKQGAEIGVGIVGAIEGGIGSYKALTATETFYRTMSVSDFSLFEKTGKIPSTGETFISPTKAFSANYEGVLVEFNAKAGTFDELRGIGVRNAANGHPYSELPVVGKGWNQTNALFKLETNPEGLQQVNIGLGKGKALEIFNSNIQSYKVVTP